MEIKKKKKKNTKNSICDTAKKKILLEASILIFATGNESILSFMISLLYYPSQISLTFKVRFLYLVGLTKSSFLRSLPWWACLCEAQYLSLTCISGHRSDEVP